MPKNQDFKTSVKIENFDIFDELIGGSSTVQSDSDSNNTKWIDIEQIVPASHQPRQFFDQEKLEELSHSFIAQGFKGAINVRVKNGKYEIVAGERRYRAAKIAGLAQVRCIVDEYTDVDAYEFAIRENLNRENLSKLEEVEGILNLMALKLKMPRQEIITMIQSEGNQIRRGQGSVRPSTEMKTVIDLLGTFGIELEIFRSKYLVLLNLPDDLKQAHLNGSLSYNHVLTLYKLKDQQRYQTLLKETIEKKLSVRQIKARMKEEKAQEPSKTLAKTPKAVTQILRQLKAAPIWDDPTKVEQLKTFTEKLLISQA